MKALLMIFALVVCCGTSEKLFGAAQDQIQYDWQSVGNLGNAQHVEIRKGLSAGYGRVDYKYSMAKNQVTNDHFVIFLSAIARTSDPGNLYHVGMGSSQGGIVRTGSSGNYQYAAKDGWGKKPVNYVNFFDAMRYANWINNGQPTGPQGVGTTEGGSYTITQTGIDDNDIIRNDGPGVFLPTEDEWFKAAFHEPGASQDGYWFYPTRSDATPAPGFITPNGDLVSGANIANYDFHGELANVGTAGPLSDSYYGISGMAGYVWEWTESIIVQGEFDHPPSSNPPRNGKWRAIMGGSRSAEPLHMSSYYRHPEDPFDGDCCRGIRLVAISVPEPSAWSFSLIMMFAIARRRERGIRKSFVAG